MPGNSPQSLPMSSGSQHPCLRCPEGPSASHWISGRDMALRGAQALPANQGGYSRGRTLGCVQGFVCLLWAGLCPSKRLCYG